VNVAFAFFANRPSGQPLHLASRAAGQQLLTLLPVGSQQRLQGVFPLQAEADNSGPLAGVLQDYLSLRGQLIPAVTVKNYLRAVGNFLQLGKALQDIKSQHGGRVLAGNVKRTQQ